MSWSLLYQQLLGIREVSRGGEDVGTSTPLVSRTFTIYINTHKPPSLSLFFWSFFFLSLGNSPESRLD